MALKPIIYKTKIALSDLNRNHYETLHLTIAQHPSETLERMTVRMLAYCINAEEHLAFTKGLSTVEEPDLWIKTLDDQIALWIDVGEPSPERLKKATRLAQHVHVYCFNSKSDTWWSQNKGAICKLPVFLYHFQWQDIQSLAAQIERTMNFSVTISENSIYIANETDTHEISWITLQPQ